jgi:hypothetical protein
MNEDIKKEPETTPGEHKKKPNLKKLKHGTISVVISVVVIAIIVVLNVIITLASDRVNLTADLTTTDFYELTATTTDYLKTVTDNVNIVVMIDEATLTSSGEKYFKQAVEVIKNYAKENRHITVEFINLTANPDYASRYAQIYQGSIVEGDIVVTSGTRVNVFSFSEMFTLDQYGQSIASSVVEQTVTSAIMYVTNKNPKKVYIMNVRSAETQDITGSVKELLGDNGYDIGEWNPNLEPIPADADVLVIDAPLADFDENTIQSFQTFLENNGDYSKNIVYLANPGQTEMKNMDNFLYDWGVVIDRGYFLTDMNSANIVSTGSLYMIKTDVPYYGNDFASGISNPDLPVIINRAMPISLSGTGESGAATVKTLLQTSETSVIFNDALQSQLMTDPDMQLEGAQYPVITVSQKGFEGGPRNLTFSNVLVISSSEMLYSGFTGESYYNNGNYFVSILNEMTGRSDTVTIFGKTSGDKTFATNLELVENLTVVFYYVIPLIIAAIAAVVLLRRRHK